MKRLHGRAEPRREERASAPDSIYNSKAAAAFLDISVATLNRLHRAGVGPPCSYVGGQRRYLRSALLDWIKTLETNSADAPRRGHREHLLAANGRMFAHAGRPRRSIEPPDGDVE